jgi:hypothetical protein
MLLETNKESYWLKEYQLKAKRTTSHRGLVSSKISWFCLEPGSIQLPSTTSRRFPYLGHLGLTVF